MAILMNFKNRKNLSRAFFCIGFLVVTCSYLRREKAMKDAIVVIAKVKEFRHPKIDRTEVDVQYVYNGKMIDNQFSLSHTDSLKINTKIRLLISRKHPVEYIKYIGVENR
jgi:hypothetical protein